MMIGFIGAGNMAGALARGLAGADDELVFCDGGSGRARSLAGELGGKALDLAGVAARADIVLLCHKPAQLDGVAASLDGAEPRAVVSVLGGVGLEAVRRAYPHAQVARAMPNTPAAIGRGLTAITRDEAADPEFSRRVLELFSRVGDTVVLPEALMDVATGLAGVFPAYLALVAEAQIDAGVRRGLTAAQATEVVVAALCGSAELLRSREGDTLGIRREVTSPGGSTARGLAALERGGLRSAFADALDAVLGGATR